MRALPFLGLLICCMASPLRAEAPAKAARSVHLDYSASEASTFYSELTVRRSTSGSFYMVCGFSHGYFGVQETGKGQRRLLFSVWDPVPAESARVADQDRVQTTYQADDVRVKRFGGEGTGNQCFFDYDWKVGETYRFLIKAEVENESAEKIHRSSYSAWFFMPAAGVWKHLATFRIVTRGERLVGLYSFIEDFRRDTESATEIRRAEFGNGWVKDTAGETKPLLRARFTASEAVWEAKDSIDAGVDGDPPTDFFLQTGDDTKTRTPLDSTIERHDSGASPADLPRD